MISDQPQERNVLIHDILKVEEDLPVFLAEESLADLITLPVTSEILDSGIEFGESIEVWCGSLLGVALRLSQPADLWLLLTDHYSRSNILQDLAGGLDPARVRTTEERYREALVEYFSISLKEELFCEDCPVVSPPLYVPERIDRLEEFLGPILPGGEMIEVCCGNGMATQSLHRLGYDPWTEDADSCEICQALKSGYLDPKRSMVLDARLLDRFFPPRSFEVVVGFMVGLIDDVNWHMWKDVVLRSSGLAGKMVLYTMYTEKEARRVADVLELAGWDGEIIDNCDRLGIYDQWAYLATR